MRDAGADQYTFHIEATDIPLELCRKIKEAGMKVGIGLKPNTPVSTGIKKLSISCYLKFLDFETINFNTTLVLHFS